MKISLENSVNIVSDYYLIQQHLLWLNYSLIHPAFVETCSKLDNILIVFWEIGIELQKSESLGH